MTLRHPLTGWFAGEPTLRQHPIRWAVWLLDELLDRIPYWNGRPRRHGGWGCRLGLSRFWWVD